MNFKTTAALIVVVLGVGGLFWYLNAGKPRTSTSDDKAARPAELKSVFDPKPAEDSIVGLTIERPDHAAISFAREAGGDALAPQPEWRMTAPIDAPVESWTVSSVVNNIAGIQSRSSYEPGQSGVTAASAGLEPPRYAVTLTDKTGKSWRLEVGSTVPLSASDTYVRVPGQKTIHIGNRELASQLKREPSEYRSKSLGGFRANEARSIEIRTGGKNYSLTRGDDGKWIIDEPVKDQAVKTEVDALLSKFAALRAADFLGDTSETVGSFGFEEPYLTVRVTTESKKLVPSTAPAGSQPAAPAFETKVQSHELIVGAAADMKGEQRYAMVPPAATGTMPAATGPAVAPGSVARVKAKDLEPLLPNLTKLRDPSIARVKETDITGVELTRDGNTVSLTRTGSNWTGSGDLNEIDAQALADLLQAIEDLKAVDYADAGEPPAKFGLDSPRETLKISASGQVEPIVLKLGAATASGRNAYVQREGRPTVYVVSSQQADRLLVSPLALRSRTIFALAPDQIRHVDLQRGPAHYVLDRKADAWALEQPANAPIEQQAVVTVVSDLARLRARTTVGRGDDARYGLDKPELVVRFDVQAGGSTQPASAPASQPDGAASAPASSPAAPPQMISRTLRVGRVDNKAYCRRDDDPFIFELDETIYRLLTAEILDRALFRFPGKDIAGIRIVAPAGTLEFERQATASAPAAAGEGDNWKFVPDPFVELSKKRMNEFADELAKLRVESWIAFQNGDLAAEGLENAPASVTLRLKDGSTRTLRLSQEAAGQLPRKAALVEDRKIFRLRQIDCEKLLRGLDAYVKPPGGEPADTKPMNIPGMPPGAQPGGPPEPPDDGRD